MQRFFAHRYFHIIACAVIAVAVLIVYSNSYNAAFQLDDTHYVVEHEGIRQLGNIPRMLFGLRGFSLTTFALNYAAGGLDVRGYHAVNVALHIITAILAYIFLYDTFRLMKKDDVWSKRIAAFTSLIFAVHPVQTQTVTYIVQRMEILASLFYLLALILFIRAAATQAIVRKILLYAAIGASYFLAFYSKEIAYTLPAAILLYDVCFIGSGSLRAIISRWPVYALLAVLFSFFTLTTVMSISGIEGADRDAIESHGPQSSIQTPARHLASAGSAVAELIVPSAEAAQTPAPEAPPQPVNPVTAGFKLYQITPLEYLYTELNVHVYYLSLLLVPINQNLDYDFPIATGFFSSPALAGNAVLNIPPWPPAISAIILLAIVGAACYMLKLSFKNIRPARRITAFFIFWFFLVLLPTSSIVPIADVINEHRVYLASLGFFTILVIVIDMISTRLFNASGR